MEEAKKKKLLLYGGGAAVLLVVVMAFIGNRNDRNNVATTVPYVGDYPSNDPIISNPGSGGVDTSTADAIIASQTALLDSITQSQQSLYNSIAASQQSSNAALAEMLGQMQGGGNVSLPQDLDSVYYPPYTPDFSQVDALNSQIAALQNRLDNSVGPVMSPAPPVTSTTVNSKSSAASNQIATQKTPEQIRANEIAYNIAERQKAVAAGNKAGVAYFDKTIAALGGASSSSGSSSSKGNSTSSSSSSTTKSVSSGGSIAKSPTTSSGSGGSKTTPAQPAAKSNQQKYLENLKSSGNAGQKKWAEKELKAGRY